MPSDAVSTSDLRRQERGSLLDPNWLGVRRRSQLPNASATLGCRPEEDEALFHKLKGIVFQALVVLALVAGGGSLAERSAAAQESTPSVAVLAKELKHPDWQVRQKAAVQLAGLGGEAVPALIEALKDENPDVRRAAVAALGDIGPNAAAAVPALRGMRKDPAVAKEVALAIEKTQVGQSATQSDQSAKQAAAADSLVPPLIARSDVDGLTNLLTDSDRETRLAAAEGLATVAKRMADAGATDRITELERARAALEASKDSAVQQQAEAVDEAFRRLELRWWQVVLGWLGEWWNYLAVFAIALFAVAAGLRGKDRGKISEIRKTPSPKKDDRPDSVSPLGARLTGRFASDKPLDPGDRDILGFREIARTVSLFLRHEKTTAPLTFAVNGPWGSGKSSLMNLLKADLLAHGRRVVWFNAWHHQRDDHLLASLIEAVRRQAVPPIWQPVGLWVRVKLLAIRLARRWRATVVLFAVGALLAVSARLSPSAAEFLSAIDPVAFFTTSLPTVAAHLGEAVQNMLWDEPNDVTQPLARAFAALGTGLGFEVPAGTAGAVLVPLLVFLWLTRNRLMSAVLNPSRLIAGGKSQSKVQQLSRQLAYRGQFAAEFHDIALALSRPRLFAAPLVIFIDDLDRCRAPAALETLEAVNFLVSSGDCFVVIGMARDRVESAIGLALALEAAELAEMAKKAEDGEAFEDDLQELARRDRQVYARDYMEKLINIEIPVPVMTAERSKELLNKTEPSVSSRGWLMLEGAAMLQRHGLRAAALGLVLAVGLGVGVAPMIASTGPDGIITQNAANGSGAEDRPKVGSRTDGRDDLQGEKATNEPGKTSENGQARKDKDAPNPVLLSILTVTGLIVFVLLGIEGRRRLRADIVKDSDSFGKLLALWQPVITARRNTPRSVKRYLNRVRYLAMRLRPDHVERDGPLVRWVKEAYPDLKDRTANPAAQTLLSETTLVALSVIEHLNPAWLESDALREPVGSDFAAQFAAKAPEGADPEESTALARVLVKHATIHNGWPPKREELRGFADIATGVRFAGETRRVAPSEPVAGQARADSKPAQRARAGKTGSGLDAVEQPC